MAQTIGMRVAHLVSVAASLERREETYWHSIARQIRDMHAGYLLIPAGALTTDDFAAVHEWTIKFVKAGIITVKEERQWIDLLLEDSL